MPQYLRAGEQYQLDNGDIANGGKLVFKQAGTETDLTTYSDEAETSANVNPIVLDSDGRSPVDIYFSSPAKVRYTDSSDVQLDERDNVLPSQPTEATWTPVLSDGTNDATASTATGYQQRIGDRMYFHFDLVLSSAGSVSGNLQIKGLGTAANASFGGGAEAYFTDNITFVSGYGITGRIAAGASVITLYTWESTGLELATNTSIGLTATTNLSMSGSYVV